MSLRLHPSLYAALTPDKPAIIFAGSGQSLTYAELEALSNQYARLMRALGLRVGDAVALCIENSLAFLPLVVACQRSGLTYVCISTRLLANEVNYIVSDSGARLVIASPRTDAAGELRQVLASEVELYAINGPVPGAYDLAPLLEAQSSEPLADETAGTEMLYTSGTTGRPKGILKFPSSPDIADPDDLTLLARSHFGLSENSVYLTPAPLYHAAPLRWAVSMLRCGGTVVALESFDAALTLSAIQAYRVTHGQFVPTHFVRMLKLQERERAAYDVSSLRLAIHSAGPCSLQVKQAMIDWWGPVLVEYYAGTEGNGMTMISSQEWLDHPGSVGRAVLGQIRICGPDGEELPVGEVGEVYFSHGRHFAYHNDPERTATAANIHGWTSLGDIGWIDAEGYLYLTERKSFMIISGGVNIAPQEIEDLLIQHPRVVDAAVIGAPCQEMGERVVAVVQPVNMDEAGKALADELILWLGQHLSAVKLPRQIDFVEQLPRHDTGKLYKQDLRAAYP
jgi:long-chain acyl-CoA synthetase